MLNLFILIIIEQFQENYFKGDSVLQNFQDSLENFRKCWTVHTLKYHGFKINEKNLYSFFVALKSPLGFYLKKILIKFFYIKGWKDEEKNLFRKDKQNIVKKILEMDFEA